MSKQDKFRQPPARTYTELKGRPVILDSWGRSGASQEKHAEPKFYRISEADLARRLEVNSDLIAVATPHLKMISDLLVGVAHVAYITDATGVVLQSRGNEDLRSKFRLQPGYDWCEARMGTNGAGTALACGEEIAVIGPEHYLDAFENCTCTAAPIRDASGKIVGAIDVTSGVDDGSTERLLLVRYVARMIGREIAQRQEAQQFSALELKEFPPTVTRTRILIVEDNPDLRYLLQHVLQDHQFEVAMANNGFEALRKLRHFLADVIVTDIFMPDKDGIETIQEVRQHYPKIKIVAISGGPSGSARIDYLAQAKEFGADAVLRKPFSPFDLVKTLENVVADAVLRPLRRDRQHLRDVPTIKDSD